MMKNIKKGKKITLQELKSIQLEILDYIVDFCDKNEIKYWLDCGTLLGAIRHSGYIPWDDDIDIGMLREDYDVFISKFCSNGKYELHCYENDDNWYLAFAKIYHTDTVMYEPDEKTGHKGCVNIDIFVYDNAPDSLEKRKKMFKKKELYRKLNSIRVQKKCENPLQQRYNIIRYPIHYLLSLFPKKYFLKKQVKLQKKYNDINTKCIGNYSAKDKMVCEKKVFDSFVDVDFEGKKYKAPIGYDIYLKSFFGNYMELPPVEKRVSKHSFVAYYK